MGVVVEDEVRVVVLDVVGVVVGVVVVVVVVDVVDGADSPIIKVAVPGKPKVSKLHTPR